MLSGPKALEGFKNSVAVLSSLMVKGDVSIGKVSDIGTLGRVKLLGTFILFPIKEDFCSNDDHHCLKVMLINELHKT